MKSTPLIPKRPLQYATLLLSGLLLYIVAGWGWLTWSDEAANHDIFWLYTGYLRLTGGASMADAFYETNPPLSVFIYTPAFWLTEHSWLSLPHAILVYSAGLLAMAIAATLYACRFLRDLKTHQIALLCGGMLVCGSVMTSPNFGQRDHFLALAAVPVMLLLMGRTEDKRPLNMMDAIILFIGTLFLLLKPHYGLLPAFLMVHRTLKQGRISALWDFDFIVMAMATLAYAVTVVIFFGDYITHILPDVVALYADSGWSIIPNRLAMAVSAGLIILGLTFRRSVSDETRSYARMFMIFAGLSFLIFIMMMKGYAYQLLPCLTFMYLAALLLIDEILESAIKDHMRRGVLLLGFMAAICVMFPDSFLPNRDAILKQQITQQVASCGKDCSFLMMGATVRVTQLISYYADKPHASRFPKFWFAEGLITDGVNLEKDHEMAERYRHYVDMITDDINHYKPRMILACNSYMKFIPWLSSYENFREAFKRYKKVKDISYNHSDFHDNIAGTRKDIIIKCTQYNRD